MDKIEFVFKGTPYELAQAAINFGDRELVDNPLMWQHNERAYLPYDTHPRQISPDTNPITIALVIDAPNPLVEGGLSAQLLRAADDKIRTLVTGRLETGDDRIGAMLAERYQRLFDELNRIGLIESPPGAPDAAPLLNAAPVRPLKENMIKRRNRVKELAGKTAEQISETLEREDFTTASVATVNRDLKYLGLVKSRSTPKAK